MLPAITVAAVLRGLALTVGLAGLGVLGAAPAQALERVGQAGEWLVGCEASDGGKAASCFVASVIDAPGYSATVLYYPLERRLVVVDSQAAIDVIARIDDMAPQSARCEQRRCLFEDRSFVDGLDKGAALALLLSGGKTTAAIDKNLRDLQKGAALARKWLADRQAPPKPQAAKPPPMAPSSSPAPPKPAPGRPGAPASTEKQIAKFGLWSANCDPAVRQDEQKCHVRGDNRVGDTIVFAVLANGAMGFLVLDLQGHALLGSQVAVAARLGSQVVAALCERDGVCFFHDRRFYDALLETATVELTVTALDRPGGAASWLINAQDVRAAATAVVEWLKLPPERRSP